MMPHGEKAPYTLRLGHVQIIAQAVALGLVLSLLSPRGVLMRHELWLGLMHQLSAGDAGRSGVVLWGRQRVHPTLRLGVLHVSKVA